MSSLSELVGLLRDASQAYYSGGNLMMDDDTYDGIVERLRELDPTNDYLNEVGSPPPDRVMKEIVYISAQGSKELEEKLAKRGMSFTPILSASVTIVVIPDGSSKETAKINVAKELGMKILTQSQFMQQYLS
jgi:NAD-dependent DNA ligase